VGNASFSVDFVTECCADSGMEILSKSWLRCVVLDDSRNDDFTSWVRMRAKPNS
jgi:hypothetical protein